MVEVKKRPQKLLLYPQLTKGFEEELGFLLECTHQIGADLMKDFIIRVCRFEKDNPQALVGLVEIVGKKGRIAFKTMDGLWEILNSSIGDEKKADDSVYIELRKKGR